VNSTGDRHHHILIVDLGVAKHIVDNLQPFNAANHMLDSHPYLLSAAILGEDRYFFAANRGMITHEISALANLRSIFCALRSASVGRHPPQCKVSPALETRA